MRSKITFLALLVILLLPSGFSFVMAEPLGPDLDITPGGSGSWQADGYYFGGTAYGTQTSFRPFHGLSAVTVIMWIVTPANEAFELLFSQRVDGTHNIRVYLAADFSIQAQLYNGGGIGAVAVDSYSLDTLTFVAMRWDKDQNSGKMDLFSDSDGLKKRTTGTGLTSVLSGNIDLKVGTSTTPATGFFSGNFLHFAIYREKLDNATITDIYNAGSDSYDPNAWHLWMLNEGSGSLFTQGPNIWNQTQLTGFDFTLAEGAMWKQVQTTIFKIVLPLFEGSLNALVVLLGLAMIPSSTVYLALNRHDLDLDKFYKFMLLFFMGFALLIGGLVG